ncbi:MAG: hypothetical protein KAI43_09015 [Candidatus Aureabacteria bacterium]|nr:hypothetical protein [Candidatus Auribacterota bacterium]
MKNKLALINPYTSKDILERLKIEFKSNIIFIPVREANDVRFPLDSHPDIVTTASKNTIIHCPTLSKDTLKQLKENGVVTFKGENILNKEYPHDAFYNCLIMNDLFIHRLDITDKTILCFLKESGIKRLINVNQGYTRCSIIPVSENAFITEDAGIAKTLHEEDLNVCLISKGHIKLENYNFGFIGGTCTTFEDTLYFFGSIEKHPDFIKIKKFSNKYGKKCVSLRDNDLEDFGGMFIF